jgi:hypothetical protein
MVCLKNRSGNFATAALGDFRFRRVVGFYIDWFATDKGKKLYGVVGRLKFVRCALKFKRWVV